MEQLTALLLSIPYVLIAMAEQLPGVLLIIPIPEILLSPVLEPLV